MSENDDDQVGINDAPEVEDESLYDETIIPQRYDLTSFGADYDVEGLVRRLERGDVFIPPFQRDYVWKLPEASRLIESLLLGLPVPGVFLAKEGSTNRLLVIDGQQRLKTLQFFYAGYFDPQPDEKRQRVFSLTKVQDRFEGLTYQTLEEKDRLKLNDSIIHATVVKQESPENDDTSIYHIFERLNNGGRKLTPQEIRVALYHGSFIDLVKQLNESEKWRATYGKKNSRLKDQELIIRFIALYFSHENYERPMLEFLNKFTKKRVNAGIEFLDQAKLIFTQTIDLIYECFGTTAFRPERSLNAAVFDSVMVAVAKRITTNPNIDCDALKSAYNHLLQDGEYQTAISAGTSNEKSVSTRIERAIKAFKEV